MDLLTRKVKGIHAKTHTEKYLQTAKYIKAELDKVIEMPEARDAIQAIWTHGRRCQVPELSMDHAIKQGEGLSGRLDNHSTP